MGKIVIIEEKADQMLDKLELVKEGICEIMECFEDSMDNYRESDEEDWDDEYEVKRRRGTRSGMRKGMRRGMSGTSRY